jgi:hypothetical protein
MSNTRWTTTRWVIPRRIRLERYQQLHGSAKYRDVFDQRFLDGLEKRRDTLESRGYRLLALQAPIYFLLAFSLVNLDLKVSLAGFSLEGVRGIREILLVVSTILGIISYSLNRQVGDLVEIMKAAIEKLSDGKADARNLLQVRYGLSELADVSTFNTSFVPGRFQFITLGLAAIPYLAAVVAMLGTIVSVQVFTMMDIWLHPNFSKSVSLFVIVLVVSAEVASLLVWWLQKGLQPVQTMEDLKKLEKLEWKNKPEYDKIIHELALKHARRGFLSKLFYPPRLPRVK